MTDDTLADERLMQRYRRGDSAAFATLYERHRAPLFRFIARQCESKAVAEELYQDVWMRIVNARDRYRPSARFTTWLYRIARNRLIDHYRRQTLQAVDSEHALQQAPGPASDNPERRTQSAQELSRLIALIRTLPEQQRTAFLLREEAGMSVAEIAACTEVNEETAKSRLRYAVNKLRAGMEYDNA